MMVGRTGMWMLVMVAACVGCGVDDAVPAPLDLEATRGVVLISIDTLRADHLGAYGYHRDTSPFFDELSGRGLLFENAIIQFPSTLTSHMSIFTGLYPEEHGVYPPDSVLSPSIWTIAQVLRDAGFRTAGHTEGGFVASRFGFDRGFEIYTEPDGKTEINVETVSKRGLRFLRSLAPSDRFFLFLHTYAVHDPYEPPSEYRSLFTLGDPPSNAESSGQRLRRVNSGAESIDTKTVEYFEAQYDASVRWVDDVLRRFLAELSTLGLDADTAIIITSDHGEEFLEHGKLAHTQVYPECVRVPLLIIHPTMARGVRISQLVESVDLAPTILSLLGLARWEQPSGSNLLESVVNSEGATQAFAETKGKGHVQTLIRRDERGHHQLLTATAARKPDPAGSWISRTATFTVDGPLLELKIRSFAVPRDLEVWVDGQLERTVTIAPHWSVVKFELDPSVASHRVTLETDGCASPHELGVGNARRCLGVRIAKPELRWFELYDLEIDPGAQNDIALLSVERRKDLWHHLSKLRWTPRSHPLQRPLSAEERRALEALGYLERSR